MPKYYKGHKIEKRNDNRWQVRYYLNKKQYTIYAKTESLCIEKLKQQLSKPLLPQETKMLFFDYLDKWYKVYKEPKQKRITLKTTKGIIENHIKKYLPNIDIQKITPLIINEALNKISGRPKEYSSQYLREIFRQAYKDQVIKIDIYESITKYRHKREQGTALTKEQRKELTNICNQTQYGQTILFYLYSGCRKGEAFTILKSDIEQNTIHISGTKTDGSNRYIPYFNKLKPIVQQLLAESKTDKLMPIAYKTLSRLVNTLNTKLSFHLKIKDLRTTFGTMCAENNINDNIIAKWLGHTNSSTTKKYYIKVLSDYEKENIAKFDTYFDT